jgi:VanZ like family
MRRFTAALWMAVIFATSCTVINRPAFVAAVADVLPGEMTRGVWTRFWYSCGLFVVKGYHAAEFALLFFLVRAVLIGFVPRRATWAAVAVCVAFAASDEWHQTFVPGRGGTLTDVAIDTAGVAAAALWTSRRRPG